MMGDRELQHAMTLDDAYVVERRLARGPVGITELVSLDGAGPFVRKRIPADRANRVAWAALGECRGRLLPRVRATYDLPDEFVVVLDYVPGETLQQLVEGDGALPLGRVRALVEDLAAALSELHAHGIVHCDVAPSNVVMTEDGACLIDFGNAHLAGFGREGAENPQGTWGFAAPEQHGFAPVDARADLYALGRVAAYALAGRLPEGNTERELHAFLGGAPVRVRTVVERACAFEPSARYQTAGDLAAAFNEACEEEPVDAPARSCAAESVDGSAAKGRSSVRRTAREDAIAACPTEGRADRVPSSVGSRALPGHRGHRRRAAIVLAVLAALVVGGAGAASLLMGGGLFDGEVAVGNAPAGDASDDDSAASTVPPSLADTGQGAAADADRAYASLELVETSWHIEDGGYIAYAFGIQNTSDDLLIEFPEIGIVGRDDAGGIVSSDTMVLSGLYPGEVQYCSGLAGNGSGADAVEFSIALPDEPDVRSTGGAASVYEITDASLVDNGFGAWSAVGEVRLARAGADQATSMGDIAVTAIVRDRTGRAIAFGDAYITMPAEGASVVFEASLWSDASADVSAGTLEVHARTW